MTSWLGDDVGEVVRKLLAKDPDDRYQDGPESLVDLQRLGGRPAWETLPADVAEVSLATTEPTTTSGRRCRPS